MLMVTKRKRSIYVEKKTRKRKPRMPVTFRDSSYRSSRVRSNLLLEQQTAPRYPTANKSKEKALKIKKKKKEEEKRSVGNDDDPPDSAVVVFSLISNNTVPPSGVPPNTELSYLIISDIELF